ncbi:AAA family ATPase [Bacillota bacterium HCP28S3_F12]
MTDILKLPVGIENFEEIRHDGFYYADKTGLIEQLLNQWGKVNLFTRPRRFGKTLNMSMLRYFFEIGTDPALFDGLYISQNKKLCEEYLGKFPVVFLSLKNVNGLTYERAVYRLTELVGMEAERFSFLSQSAKLAENEKDRYRALTALKDGRFTMSEDVLISSLQVLSQLLYRHFGKKVIVLIDEYDVPLDKAFQHGYYRQMAALIRGLFGQVLKTNDSLQFAVLTGCLRVSKESIFTGLNNFKVLSITDARFDEQFGFTEEEVRKLLAFYHLESHLSEIKNWYDGYRFGNADIFCPWDVIGHVDRLMEDPEAEPQPYWINTSGNDLVKRFIDKADKTTRDEIERLMTGGTIEKEIRMELTYEEIDRSIDNLWSVLFTTGYLTLEGEPEHGICRLRIPNEEVREVFRYQIRELFRESVMKNTAELEIFWRAFSDGEGKVIEEQLNRLLGNSISVFDTRGDRRERENSYHTFLLGMLVGNAAWGVKSNRETGEGFADLLVETENPDAGIIIELKSVDRLSELDEACRQAIAQIHERRYDRTLRDEGRDDILAYGIAFYKKRCRVAVEKM